MKAILAGIVLAVGFAAVAGLGLGSLEENSATAFRTSSVRLGTESYPRRDGSMAYHEAQH